MAVDNTQLEIAESLQIKVLKRFDTMLDSGEITSTDMATLVRLLSANGWQLDRSRVPSSLRDKLTQAIDPKSFEDDGSNVLPFRSKTG